MVASVWTKAPSEIVMDLVAAANSGFDAVRSNFEFTTSPSGSDLPSGSTKNTQLVVGPTEAGSATYEGTVKVAYDRLGIDVYAAAVLNGNPANYTADPDNGKPTIAEGMAVADIQTVVNSVLDLGTTSTEAEFDTAQFALTKISDTQYSVALVPAATAFLFTGTFTLLIDIPSSKTQTSSVVQNTEMDGLDAPSNGG